MRINQFLLPLLAALTATSNSIAGECCPPGASVAPCCGCIETNDFGTLYSAWPNVCYPCPPTGWGGSFDVSFLYWQAQEDGLAFAIKNNPRLTPSSELYADMNGRFIGLDFHWEPAFKINTSLIFTNGWDLDARWTSFYSRSHHTTAIASVNGTTTSGLYPLWVLPQSYFASPSIYGRAHAVWQLHLNTIDLELGANQFLTSKLSLRLHGGVKAILINQLYRVRYTEGITSNGIHLGDSGATLKNECYGAGPRIGLNSKWFVAHGWSIAGDLAGSLTLNSFTVKRDDQDLATSTTLYSDVSTFREHLYIFRPNLEALLGVSWDKCFGCQKQYSFGFLAAYELQYFWEQNLMPELVSNQISFLNFPARGDLHCHGLTATLRFGF